MLVIAELWGVLYQNHFLSFSYFIIDFVSYLASEVKVKYELSPIYFYRLPLSLVLSSFFFCRNIRKPITFTEYQCFFRQNFLFETTIGCDC